MAVLMATEKYNPFGFAINCRNILRLSLEYEPRKLSFVAGPTTTENEHTCHTFV